MTKRPGRAALAAFVALGLTTPASAESTQKPWEFFKELLGQSPVKARKTARTTSEDKPSAGKVSGEEKPSARTDAPPVVAAFPAPLPRRRPAQRSAATLPPDAASAKARDFNAAFEPPQVLKLPPSAAPPAPDIADAGLDVAEPEPIPVGRPGAASGTAANVPFPVPRARPDHDTVTPLAMLPEDDAAPTARPARPPPHISACTRSLDSLGVDAAPLAPVSEGACKVASPTSVISFEDGAVELPVKALVDCEMAATAARWLKDSVQPAARDELGSRVTGLRVAASYDCRSRNHVAGAKLSEHAFGNAIDFAAFRVDGRWIEVGGDHDVTEQRFLERIRSAACGPFKTVLGPGSDSYHTDHLHLDLAHRRTAGPSKGLYCK
jgi:hypothetical protein